MTAQGKRIVCGILMAGVLASSGAPARADEFYTFVVKRQDEKAKSRWSIAEWLETRDRMRLMDLWLALHTSAPYEFWIKGDFRLSDTRKDQYPGVGRFSAAAYSTIFGLETEKSWSGRAPWVALFDLRFFGRHVQNTNLTAQMGLRSQGGVRHLAYGVAATLYAAPKLGLDGYYRWFQNDGKRYEVGPFLDFGPLRLFGKIFGESQSMPSGSDLTHTGVTAGAQLFM